MSSTGAPRARRAVLAGTLLALSVLASGCADLWGFDDLTTSADGGEAGAPGDAQTVGPDGSPSGRPDAMTQGEAGLPPDATPPPPCDSTTTILACGACGNVCDNLHSNGAACAVVGDVTACQYTACAPGWQNCDRSGADTNGCESSTTSTTSCGACGNVCDAVHSLGASCVVGDSGVARCVYAGCVLGYADCDSSGTDTDGCETSLATPTNCGTCGNVCDATNSQGASCPDGVTCMYTGCSSGYADCNTAAPDLDGCDTKVASATCNACGQSCDLTHSLGATCDTSSGADCKYTGCTTGYADCNTTPPNTNGCETQLTTIMNCGVCGRSCDTRTSNGAACTGTACTYTGCQPGYANCEATAPDTNGCETSLTSPSNCGACGRACSTSTGQPSCNATTCSYACNGGQSDCNGGTAPDLDGCECATPGCCGTGCQTTHSNGVGANYFDCNATGTFTQAAAQAACAASAGAGHCAASSTCCALSALGLCVGNTADSVCGIVGGGCFCWQYGGNIPGTVQAASPGNCTASCGASGDPRWD